MSEQRKPSFISARGYPQSMDPSDTATFGGLTLGGAIVMDGYKVTGLGAASGANDALAYGQVGASLKGLAVTDANLTMDGYKVTGLGAASGTGEALTFGQTSASLQGLAVTNFDVTMGAQKVTGLGAASNSGDALSFGQVGASLKGLAVTDGYKVTGLAAATFAGDALAFGQSGASLQGLAVTTNDVTMGAQKVTGLGAASSSGDAISYAQSNASLTGLALTGALTMATFKVTGVGAATDAGDALSFGQVGASVKGLAVTGADLTMDGYKVTGLGAASGANDALAFGQSGASLAGLTLTGNLAMGNTYSVTGLLAPNNDGDATNKLYVDNLVVTGGRIKEAVLDGYQLDNTQGIEAAEVLFFSAQPTSGDNVTFTDGVTSNTYTFVANVPAETEDGYVSVETSAVSAMQRLVTRMNNDPANTKWGSAFRTNMQRINASGAIVVCEKTTAAGASASRIYGTWAVSDGYVVEFASGVTPTVDVEYNKTSSAQMATSDPGAGRFGLRRQVSAMVDCEIHCSLNDNTLYAWEADSQVWVTLSGGSSIPAATSASGGGTQGKVSADSDYGLVINSGVLKVNLTTNPGLTFTTDGAVKKLEVKPNTAKGIQVGASGVEATVDGYSVSFNALGQLQSLGGSVSMNVSEAVAVGDPLYISGNDTVGKATTVATGNVANVIGLSVNGQATIGQPTKVIKNGPATGVLGTSGTAGAEYWLASGGGLTAVIPTSGNRLIRMGFAINAADLEVSVTDFGMVF